MAKNTKSKDIKRPPIITVMGHVDHGKTSILDVIRKTNVQAGEHGGITQHIGAYQITHKSQKITFIDTPGHAAFSQMRARGGRAADIVVLVVAAGDGVKPQTKEAIKHAKAADVPMIVAINKMDVSGADPQKVKRELAQENVLTEDWGGDVVAVEVSAKTGAGLDNLLEAILAVAELLDLQADPDGELEALIIESRLDDKRGGIVSAIVKNGILKVGGKITASGIEAKVRFMMDDKGRTLKEATPSTPVEILGFKKPPHIGDSILEEGSELSVLAEDTNKVEIIGPDTKKTVPIIIKADTQGTLEAIKASLSELVTASVGATFSLKFLLTATGNINDSNVLLASASNALIVGFGVKYPSTIEDLAESLGVKVKVYNTIYELIDDIKDTLEGTAATEEAKIKGRAKIIKTFKLESGDVIAGCQVLAGAIKDTSRLAIYDKDPADLTEEEKEEPLYIGKIKKLKKGKDDTKLVGKDNECGLLLKPKFEDIKADLWIEVL